MVILRWKMVMSALYPYAAAMREMLRTARLVCTPRAHEGGGVFQQEFRKGLYLVGMLHQRERGGQGREARFLEA